jgi:TonB family protein
MHVAVVGSPLRKQLPAYYEGAIPGKGSDQGGEWFDVGTAVPKDCVGAPVVNEKGELVGIVTSKRPDGAAGDVARKAGSLESLLASINPDTAAGWQVADNPLPPAEGPTPTPSPTPSRFAKIPVVQADRGNSRLIYSPRPAYPTAARHSYLPIKGNGRYKISFDSAGHVKEVTVLESTRSDVLDAAATDALRRWKAAPGQEWNATVPISFQP